MSWREGLDMVGFGISVKYNRCSINLWSSYDGCKRVDSSRKIMGRGDTFPSACGLPFRRCILTQKSFRRHMLTANCRIGMLLK